MAAILQIWRDKCKNNMQKMAEEKKGEACILDLIVEAPKSTLDYLSK